MRTGFHSVGVARVVAHGMTRAVRLPSQLKPYAGAVTAAPTHWILTLVCEDKPGIVHAISGAIVMAEGNITESQQFSSEDTGRFFMRLQVESDATRERFERALAPVT